MALFPVEVGAEPVEFTYAVPAGTIRHLITGLAPDAGYDVTLLTENGEQQVSIRPGTGLRSDAGGVLVLRLPG